GVAARVGGDDHKVEMTCPACAAPVRDRWQACPSCGYRMHVFSTAPTCPSCHHIVEQEWHVCPHCAYTLPEVPEEQRMPARALMEAARREGVKGTALAAPVRREDTLM
ncbi:MAG: zinc ribbon domain-containing protein, partial [Chloroflexi bacterium]|nr:zinc ribbon domain-containing protein [Chloroflexota bacterium]